MGSIDLNIIQRGVTDGFKWSAEKGKILAADLGTIGESRTDNSSAMNALPTPFARFFVFKEAFRRVLEEKQNPGDVKRQAGRAYAQLVSNTLDVFELLFNLKWHSNQWKSQNRKIVIREWNWEDDLLVLKKNVPVLGNAVESYFLDDLGESSKRMYFIVLEDNGKEYLLAASSPMTGFITPPDMDLVSNDKGQKEYHFVGECYSVLDSLPIKRRSRGSYFKDIVLFGDRDATFKNYLYNKLFADGSTVNDKMYCLRDYIKSFAADQDIVTSWSNGSLKEILSEDANPVIVNGLQFYYTDGKEEINYLSDVLVKMPYLVNSDRIITMNFNRTAKRNYDYMIPFTDEGLGAIQGDNFDIACNEKTTEVDVILSIGGNEYKKTYKKVRDGQSPYVFDMSGNKMNFDFSIFPNVLSPVKEQNNYFKVLCAIVDENFNQSVSIDDVNIDFFVKDENGGYVLIKVADTDGYEHGVKQPVVRSVQSLDSESGTKYFELFDTQFDALRVRIKNDGQDISFVVFPKWDRAIASGKSYTYAIDLGTSNTYISRREKGKSMEPEQLTMSKAISSFLQDYARNGQKTLVSNIEDSYPPQFSRQFKTEFVPPLIDGKNYKFPTRTALCVKKDVTKLSLFDNSNIAFFYENIKCPASHGIISSLKWSEDEDRLRVFIRELLLLIKADILQENGNIADTEIIWFRPLSFKKNIRENFARIWKEESSCILSLTDSESQIKCYTESEAPYYYFDTKNQFANRSSVAVLDIGGGTADFVYYFSGKPEMANSVRFGCDVIWGEGLSRVENSKQNGIYLHYKDSIKFPSNPQKDEIYKSMIDRGSEASSKDILNFWITNDRDLGISNKLREDFSPVFVYHYVALLYYMMSMFKARGLQYPRTIIFSGNGSRYLDNYITKDCKTLETIVKIVVSKVFADDNVEKIEIVLPEQRKESTCYGGLYHKDGQAEPESVVFVGDGPIAPSVTFSELKKRYSSEIKSGVIKQVQRMNAVYQYVMSELIKNTVVNPFDTIKLSETVSSIVETALESNYQKIIAESSDEEAFNDSLFFYPVVQGIFKLTQVCPKAKK